MNNLDDAFKVFLENPSFQEALELAKINSEGKIWIIGGYVYKNLTSTLYGIAPYEYDIDFIVEKRKDELPIVPGWDFRVNRYGVKNYIREKNEMSFTELRTAVRVSGTTNPTIEDFLKETPLNIQSIAYDMEKHLIIGEKGIEALKSKIVKVNNLPQAEFYAQRKEKSLKQILQEKAKGLGFEVIF